jgi:hypothetical protein
MYRSVAGFVRVGSHLINLEAIAHVKLTKGGGADVLLQGPRKSLQNLRVPAPAGEELWWFVQDRMVVAEFGTKPEPAPAQKASPKAKSKKKAKTKAPNGVKSAPASPTA